MIDLFGHEGHVPNKELLESMGPSYWKEFREMEANYAYAGWTLDLMEYQFYRLINNLFIMTCDEQTLEKYEKLFGITPQDSQSLDSRRMTVLLLYVGRQKTSFSSLRQYVKSTVGADTVLLWDMEHDYTLRVRILSDDDDSYSIAELRRAMAARVPAHILMLFSQNVIILISGSEAVISRTKIREIINWWSGSNMLDGMYHMDGSISMSQVRGPTAKGTIRQLIDNSTYEIDFSIRVKTNFVLDGSAKMDGTMTMAAGREEL